MIPARNAGEPFWSVIHCVHARDDGEKHLSSANVARRLLAPDVLLPGLESHAERRISVRVTRDADDASGNLPFVLVPGREESGMRSAVSERNAKALGVTDDDISSPFPRRGEENETEKIRGNRNEGIGGGVLRQHTEHTWP